MSKDKVGGDGFEQRRPSVRVDVSKKYGDATSAELTELVEGGRVVAKRLALEFDPEKGKGLGNNSTIDLTSLARPGSIVDNAIQRAPDWMKNQTVEEIKAKMKEELGIEADNEIVLAAIRRRWEDYDACLAARIVKRAPDSLSKLPLAGLTEGMSSALGMEVSEEVVLAAMRERWENYDAPLPDASEDEGGEK